MHYTTLVNAPEFVEKTYKLIEESFEYNEKNSFYIDFFPLMNKENHYNCHIVIDNDEVIAHIGSLTREVRIAEDSFKITMYGGIAVSPKYRGKGVFKNFFNEVQKFNTNSSFHLLWSEKIDLYKKFNYFPCLKLTEYIPKESEAKYKVVKTKLNKLTENEHNIVKNLYLKANEIRFNRDDNHWTSLKGIISSDLYLIYDDEKLINYFFKGKGQDLIDTIHEYGFVNEEQLKLMLNYGKVWTPYSSTLNSNELFATLLRIGNEKEFTEFLKKYLKIDILNFGNEINFKYNNQNYRLETEEFLQGVFGPGRFNELKNPYLFISGLDSI